MHLLSEVCVSVWASDKFHNSIKWAKYLKRWNKSRQINYSPWSLEGCFLWLLKFLWFHSVSFICWVSFEKNKSLCHKIVFPSCQKEVCTGRVVYPHPPAYPPQQSVNSKTDCLPGNQLRQSWTYARQDSNCNLLCEQNWGTLNNCHCGDYCETRYGGSPCVLPEWDQNVSRFAFGMPVGGVGEGGKEKTGSLWKELYIPPAGQTNAESMAVVFA